MDKKLSLSSYIVVGSMLFGLFFGAGNLIFPVHMGQEAGASVYPATIGFLITAIGLPFLGVVAIGVSKSKGLFDLASRIHPIYGYIMTILLYLTIGPFFALPRTGTVSYEIGISPFIPGQYTNLGLAIFTIVFFLTALFFSLRPSEILTWVGKVLNPVFLVFLAVLIITSIIHPMGSISDAKVIGTYVSAPFFKGFLEGYNTMDALASLAFGIIVVRTLRELGVKSPGGIAVGTIKSGIITILLMGLIYGFLAYIGATSVGKFSISENGGIALAQIADYYFNSGGGILLAIIVTVACLKTAIGLITACSETFYELFPGILSYRGYVVLFTILACLIANIGLTQIILLSIPILMLLYPLAIALIMLGLLSQFFKNRQCVYALTTLFTLLESAADCMNVLPAAVKATPFIQHILNFYGTYIPFFNLGMGWVVPMITGFILSVVISFFTKPRAIQV